ncbi:MAG: PAS domain S-box protein [Desulfobacteraceae bacterium]
MPAKELERELALAKTQLAAAVEKRNDLELQLKRMAEDNSVLQRIIDDNPCVTFSWRVQQGWPVVFVSDNVRRFGYAPEDFYSGRLKFADIIHTEDRQQINRKLFDDSRSLRDDKSVLSYRIVHSHGREAWIDHHVWIMRNSKGEMTHMGGALLDITDKKSAELALTESESKFRNLTEKSLVGVYIIQDGLFKYCNPKFAEMYGYRPDEIIDKLGPSDLSVPEDRALVAENVKKRIGGEIESMHYELRGLSRDKRIINSEVFGSRIQYNKKPAVIGSVLDITARKQVERNLRLTQYAVDHSATAILRVDPDARITYANKAASRQLGYTEQELSAKTIPDIDTLWTQAFWYDRGLPMLRKKRVNRFESEHLRKDGTRYPVEVICYLAKYEDTEQYYAFFTDISDRKRAEAEIRKHREHLEELVEERTRELTVAKEQAEVANRTKSEFLANMSHEIRTPLNGVIGMLHLLRDTDLTSEQMDFADTAASSASALLNIINDILDFSKIEAGKLDFENIAFDLRKLMEDLTEMLDLQALEKGLEMTCFVEPRTPKQLIGDPWRLRQVLLNLATNALKFTSKGEVNIQATVKDRSSTDVEMFFSVIDTGIGIPASLSNQLFKPFSQGDSSTTRKFGGTGLGLAVCKKLVDLMGGRIGVERRPEQGARFWFTARLGTPKPVQDQAGSDESDRSLENKCILVMDNSASSRDILTAYLTAHGCKVRLAASGSEALELIVQAGNTRHPIDLVIVDADMPSMSCEELGQTIRAHPLLPAPPKVMLMDRGRGKARGMTWKGGFDAIGYKPIRWSGLKDSLMSVLSPRKRESSPDDESEPVPQAPEGAGGPLRGRILLAEDNPINKTLALHILEKLGYAADAVTSGRSALDALARQHYDLILMDVQMPEMDGLETTRSIRSRELENMHFNTGELQDGRKIPERKTPNHTADALIYQTAGRNLKKRIPIIAMTAHAMSGDREKCLAAGMDDYISKPIDPELLAIKIAYWLRKAFNH